jgi:hypothetical protein
MPVQSYSTPAAGARPSLPNVTTATESGECGVHATRHVNTPHPLCLMLPSFLAREHRVGEVAVPAEDRVVVAQSHGGTLA